MIENLLYLLFFAAFTAFMVNRLYVGLSRRAIQIKGVVYSRAHEPIMYWIVMVLAVWGIAVGLLMTAAGCVWTLGGE